MSHKHYVWLPVGTFIQIQHTFLSLCIKCPFTIKKRLHAFRKFDFLLPLRIRFLQDIFRRVFIWHFLLIFSPSKQSLEYVTSPVSGSEFRIKWKKPNPNPNPSLPAIVFHNKIYVFIIIFTTLSFLRLIRSLFLYMRRKCQLDYMVA